ncbi:carbon-monoxide dehydrogenase large subunit [Streptosporangium subroseum]|uniref:Carbon-monoxide dehydrogenase large subunit n=1 Tax=Streptosporangium subroseum TaxID=106412 RepID=A0A239JDM7_9ACTN|nr:xanthine dehydrogenase family protein molybdopterin-binding subunit [Streptosporangium subroseum]SNT04146.1 carbon-monoxide dehydrogenase large subunit [Streptosporangium subroseum]
MSEQLDAGLIAEQIAESDQLSRPSGAHEVGKARRRKEDARLVTGRTTWTDNIQLPGMLYVAFLRSPMAHARITRVDTSAARTRPGVVAVYSGQDFADEQGSLPCAWPVTEDIVIPDHPPMAVEEVRYVGEAVACVVATDRYKAADALEAIEVDYEPLDAVIDMTEALAEGSPKVHETGNKAFTWKFAGGDIDAAFRDAPVVIDRTYVQQRLIPTAMEPRAVVATTDGETFTLYSSTQIPHVLRVMLALTTGIPEHKLRVIAPDVGGGFGSKLQVTAEEVLGLLITRRLGKPVKWTESRTEGNLTVHHGRDQLQRISIAAGRDGLIRGVRVDLLADMGAYLMLVTPGIPILGAFMYNGIYKMDAYDFTCTGVFTTKMPTDAYRGAGRPEATFAIERAMDELAHELGLDPIELRRRNWITHEEFPYTTICGLTYDSGNYEAATDRALALLGYDKLRAEQADRRDRRDPVQLGIGVSTFTEMCGLAPSRVLGSLSYGAGGWEHSSVRMLPTGKVEVVTGTSPHGQGHETAWSQIVADALGVPFDDVSVLHGDTSISHKGMDTYGSRSLVVGGIAVLQACEKVKDKARELAAHMLEASADDIEFAAGTFKVRGTDSGKTIQELALATFAAHDLPDRFEPGLDADATFDPDNFSFPHGTHLCAIEVDTETGATKIRSYVAVDDVGSVVNPLIVEGQVHGGIAQGIAQALFEEAVYDSEGNMLTTTMADYLIPSASDLPDFTTDRTETPATSNPLGVKGVGEAGTIASTPAIVNAIVDALRPYGVHDVRMPCTPERVWRTVIAAGETAWVGPGLAGNTGGTAEGNTAWVGPGLAGDTTDRGEPGTAGDRTDWVGPTAAEGTEAEGGDR